MNLPRSLLASRRCTKRSVKATQLVVMFPLTNAGTDQKVLAQCAEKQPSNSASPAQPQRTHTLSMTRGCSRVQPDLIGKPRPQDSWLLHASLCSLRGSVPHFLDVSPLAPFNSGGTARPASGPKTGRL